MEVKDRAEPLSQSEKDVLEALTKYKKENKRAPSQVELAAIIGKSRWRVLDLIKALEAKTYVTRDYRIARSEVIQRDSKGNKIRPL